MSVFFVILQFGHFFLSAWGNRAYQLVEKKLPWTEAQRYCRAMHLDLATVDTEEQLGHLIKATERSPPLGHIWTGLYDDVNSWRWSLQQEGYYGPGEDQFRRWKSGEPNNAANKEACGVMLTDGTWKGSFCTTPVTRPFLCYRAGASPHFVYVGQLKTWSDARSYCRDHYTDLASVRNQSENDQLLALMLPSGRFTWIGLYRDTWKWSDGSPVLFTRFNGDTTGLPCVALNGNYMVDDNCTTSHPFVCNDYPFKQVVKFEVQKHSSLNLEGLTESMLEQFKMELKKYGLDGNLKLTWRKQPDGKVFSRKKKNEQN